MRLAVLADSASWYYRDLLRAVDAFAETSRGKDTQIAAFPFTQLATQITKEGVKIIAPRTSPGEDKAGDIQTVDLQTYDAVLVRTMPPGSLEQIVFRMDLLAQLQRSGVLVMNEPRALETAIDKYLTTARLAAAGVLTPATAVCQTLDDALEAFTTLGGDVVVKPLFGGEGRGLIRVSDRDIAWRVFKSLTAIGAVIYLQAFTPSNHTDLRLMVIGEKVLGMKRHNAADWRANISRGGKGEPLVVTDELATLARHCAKLIGADVAGVDLLPGDDGRLYAIEVNAVPGWRGLAKALDIDVAQLVLEFLFERLRRRR